MFPFGITVATAVYGQGGSFSSGTSNLSGVSASSLSAPYALSLDATGGLYVADGNNNRVLYYPSGSTSAWRVYGQAPEAIAVLTASAASLSSGLSIALAAISTANATALAGLASLGSAVAGLSAANASAFAGLAALGGAVSSVNATTLALSNTLAPMAAQFALPFAYSSYNTYGVSAYSLYSPNGILVDPMGGVYLADMFNNRVLHYSRGSPLATSVLGQGGSLSTAAFNGGGGTPSASGFYHPVGVASDASGGLFVLDQNNNRMLYFAAGATAATYVWGQGGSFTSSAANMGGAAAANTMNQPRAVALDSSGKPYVADFGHTHKAHFIRQL